MASDESQTTRPTPLRVDVAGVVVYVRSDFERRHLESVNHELARLKLQKARLVKRLQDAGLSTPFEALNGDEQRGVSKA